MRYSADSDDDYGVSRRGKKRGKFYADEPETYAKRNRHLPRLAAEDAHDDTDGLPEGDRWTTWDQTESLVPNDALGRVPPGDLGKAVAVAGSSAPRPLPS